MRHLLFLLLLVSSQVFAVDWTDLEVDHSYKITQSFQLTQLERSGAMLDVTQGQQVTLKDIVPLALPGFPMVLFIFDYQSCPGPAMRTDQEIIPVQGTSPMVEVGVELEKNCELNVYLESKDAFSTSLFE